MGKTRGVPPLSGIDEIIRRIRDLEVKVRLMEGARRLESASIGSGGLTIKGGAVWIKDTDGNTLITLDGDGLTANADGTIAVEGILDVDGSVRIHDGGTLTIDNSDGDQVALSQLAFGAQGADDATAITPTLNTWDTTSGPSLDFELSSGRMMIIVTCRMVVGSSGTGTPCQGSMSFQLDLDGPDGVASIEPSRDIGLHYEFNGLGMHTTGQSSFVYLQTTQSGPTSGTLTAAYMADSVGSPSNATTFSNRSIAILPY